MATILSLFDYSGNWPRPYKEAGYTVISLDVKHGVDVLDLSVQKVLDEYGDIHGIMAAPPCTHFSISGAQHWKAKDEDVRTTSALALVDKTIELADGLDPAWWVLENPVGRLPKLRPETLGRPVMYFQPCDYGDPWNKKTGLWGQFNSDLQKDSVEPVRYCAQGSWTQNLGGSSERTKMLRSLTPPGFAKAFFEANP